MYKEEEPRLIRLGEKVDRSRYDIQTDEFGTYVVPLRTALSRSKRECEKLKAQLQEKDSPYRVEIGKLNAYIEEQDEKIEHLESRLASVKEENKKCISGIKKEEMYAKLMKDKTNAVQHSHSCQREVGRLLTELNKKDREITSLREELARYKRICREGV